MITLATLENATEQEIFTQAKNHLLKQMKKSEEGSFGKCVYKNKEGLKCAAGCFISDEEYKEKFEGKNWFTVCDLNGIEKHKLLIYKLQYIHDNKKVEDWKKELKKIAKSFNLNF